ncbi:mitochondrial uncoupling protein 4 [Patella vulgata]|uniref:mitochondrial uncoupling protein 4 n=1 Tax=Patella vulgata TaxID=6465 RepID=UPI0024A7DD44|nr:mitochondrial uncoupling protein 4 [Patella vulgata]
MAVTATKRQDTFLFKYTLSATSAIIAESVTYPLDLTKTRLQIQGEAAQHKSHGKPTSQPYRGMIKTAFGIASEEGFFKLWQGVSPALYRHVFYSGCRMTFYELLRDNVLGKNKDGTFPLWKATIASTVAGAGGQFVASPTDLIKVQMQMEGKRRLEGKPPRVKSSLHALTRIVAEGGVRGLWSGWVPNCQRAALVNMGDLVTYDTVKHQLLAHTSLKDNYVTHMISSGCSGIMAALLGTPADVIKTRIMNQPTKDGKGLLYHGSVDCLIKTIKQEGFFALYKGLIPIWIRMAPWSCTFWLCYEKIRKYAGTTSF